MNGTRRCSRRLAVFAGAVFLAAAPPPGPRLEERLDALRREVASPKPPAPQIVSQRLTAIASEFLQQGNFAEAIELLSEALGRDPDNGTALAQLIIAYLRNGDLEFADFYLEQAIQTTARSNPLPAAYRTIGDLFASLHRLDEAVSAWDYFRRLGGSDPAVDAELERARGELSVRQPQRLRTSERFLLYTDVSISEGLAARIGEHLESDLARLATFFASSEEVGAQIVIVYGGRAYFSLVSIPTWVSGVFDGKIRVSLDAPGRWSPELAAVLSHELTHAYLRAISRARAPAWLHEGFAQWFQGQRISRAELRAWFSGRKVRTPDEMEAALVGRQDRENARDVYLEALGLTEFLIEERGAGAVGCLVADLAGGTPFEDALARESGWSPVELIQRWIRALDRSPGLRPRRGRVGAPS